MSRAPDPVNVALVLLLFSLVLVFAALGKAERNREEKDQSKAHKKHVNSSSSELQLI